MRKRLTLLVAFSFAFLGLKAQIFSDDFSNPANWNYAGTTTIAGPGAPGTILLNNNQLELRAFRGTQTRRVRQHIGTTFSPSQTWRLEYEITPLVANQDNVAVFALTDTPDHWFSNSAGSTVRNNTSSVHVVYGDQLGPNNQIRLHIRGKYLNNWGPPSDRIDVNPGTTYYIRAERHTAEDVVLSVYTDPARTVHAPGSPVCHKINDQIGGLQYFQVSNNTIASHYRISDLDFDNVEIYTDPLVACGDDCDIEANMVVQYDGCQYWFTNTSVMGQGNTFMGSVINYDDGSYEEINLGQTLPHSYSFPFSYTPCITTFSYYFDGTGYSCCSDEYCLEEEFYHDCRRVDDSRPLPEPEECFINADLNATVGCQGNVTFTNNSTINGGANHLTTVVDLGDGSAPFEIGLGQNFTHQFTQNGTYEVCITVFAYYYSSSGKFECCEQEACVTVTIENVNEPCHNPGGWNKLAGDNPAANPLQLMVAPNSVNGVLNVSFSEGTQRVRLTSISGQIIKDVVVTGETQLQMDLSETPQGIYFISVQNGDHIETEKVVKY